MIEKSNKKVRMLIGSVFFASEAMQILNESSGGDLSGVVREAVKKLSVDYEEDLVNFKSLFRLLIEAENQIRKEVKGE